jgi:murein DD-endopeptidase MepM/ murein hydrolase activator NlpD
VTNARLPLNLFLVVLLLLLTACAAPRAVPASSPRTRQPPAEGQPPPGVFHRIEPGQTLYTISRTYGVSLKSVVAANELADPDRIDSGTTLFIPGAPRVLDVPATALPGMVPDDLFRKPVNAPLNSPYGQRWGRMHHGVDLGAPAGAPVRAARGGRVSYSGSGYRGYGKLVILDHDGGYQTLYAHNRRLLVRTGQRVRPGDVIARVGATGNATAAHLHFEIRKDGRPLDPARFLPF